MSEVTAEQLRWAIDSVKRLMGPDLERIGVKILVNAADLLVDAPLTLAALQAGAEERGGLWCLTHEVHVRWATASNCAAGAFSDDCRLVAAVVLVPRSE